MTEVSVEICFVNLVKGTHDYNTRLSSRMTYVLPQKRTHVYGIFNIRYQGAKV